MNLGFGLGLARQSVLGAIISAVPHYSDLAAWIDPSDSDAVTSSDGIITALTDKSPSPKTVTISGDPRIGLRSLNGEPVMTCLGGQEIKVAGIPNILTDEITMFMVMMTDYSSNDCPWSFGNGEFRAFANGGQSLRLTGGGYSGDTILGSIDLPKLFCMAHDTATTEMRMNGVQDSSAQQIFTTNSTDLFIANNGGNSATAGWVGIIAEVLVYDRKLTPSEIVEVETYLDDKYNVISLPANISVIGAGQSNMRNLFTSYDAAEDTTSNVDAATYTGRDAGQLEFIKTMETNATLTDVEFIDGSTPSSAANKENDSGAGWWYDHVTETFGAVYDNFITQSNAAAYDIPVVVWNQGGTDGTGIGSTTVSSFDATKAANYKTALKAIFAKMRADLGDQLIIVLSPLSTKELERKGHQAVREIQREVSEELDYVFLANEITQFGTRDADNLHLPLQGAVDMAWHLGLFTQYAMGRQQDASVYGSTISDVSRTGMVVTVTLAHDIWGSSKGDDFTPTTGITGFEFWNDGYDGRGDADATEITISSAVRTNATTITLTLSSLPTDDEYLIYASKGVNGINHDNMVLDNSARTLPLRSTVWGDTGSGFEKVN